MAKTKKAPNPDRLPVGRFLAWRMRDWSLAANFIVMSYLTIYCTDTLKMPAALVGTLLLASKILDGIGEMFAGYIVDNTRSKFGKGRPYEFCILGLWICTYFLFSTPDMGIVGKSIWVVIFYALVQSVFQTMLAAAQTPYMKRAWANKRVLVKLQSYGGILGTLLSAIVSISFPILMRTMATSHTGWSKLVMIYAIPLGLIGLLRFVFVKETYKVEGEAEELIKLSEILKVFKTNKYVWILAGLTLLTNLLTGLNSATYYFTYVVGDIGKFGSIQALTMVLLLVMIFFPVLIKKFSISQLIFVSAILGIVGNMINYIAGGNMILLTIAFLISGMGSIAPAYLAGIMLLDCVTYSVWKGHPRVDGAIGALGGLATNVGSGIGSALMGFLLGAAGYVGGSAVQTTEAMSMIRALYSIVPACVYAIIAILMFFFDLEKKIPQMEKEISERSAQRSGSEVAGTAEA
jgi:Na+/melibiose symporter-like transporter